MTFSVAALFDDDFFSLGAPVGPGHPNRREDVIKVETILGNTGDYDIGRFQGPVGYFGEPQETAVKSWQERNKYKVDGTLLQNGPTITGLKKQTGGLLGGLSAPMSPPVQPGDQKPNSTQQASVKQADNSRFDRFAKGTFDFEGGYSNDPSDRGGETNHGITKGTLDAYQKKQGGLGEGGRSVSVKDLTKEQAQAIYKKEYYDGRRIGDIGDEKTAGHIFDLGVNHSTGAAGKMVQKAVNAVIPDAKLKVDGVVGDKTIAAINKATPEQVKAINNAIANEREAYYRHLVDNDPSQARFLNGWLKRASTFRQ